MGEENKTNHKSTILEGCSIMAVFGIALIWSSNIPDNIIISKKWLMVPLKLFIMGAFYTAAKTMIIKAEKIRQERDKK